MNIVTDYTKNQLDRSSYVSEDRYKRALDLNRIRLATQKIIGLSNRYAYYYNEAMYKRLVSMIPSRYNIDAGLGVLALIDNNTIIDTTDDEDQLRMAEETYGKETIEAIIDVVTGDDDLGDYDEDEEDTKRQAEEQAYSDSDSDDMNIKIPPFDIPGKTNPITGATKETGGGGKTVQETVEEIAKTGTEPGGTTPEPSFPGTIIVGGLGAGATEAGTATVTIHSDGTATISNDGGSTTITVTEVSGLPDGGQVIKGEDSEGQPIVVWSEGQGAGGNGVPSCDTCDMPFCDGRPVCDMLDCVCDCCVNDFACDEPSCDEPPCDCDCDCDCDCCDSDCDCVCDTCDCCVNDCVCDTTPCDCDCSSDSECSGDCNDCCIGDNTCAHDAGCACDCCVNDCDCCISDSCDCDCGNDCDNYGDCIDSCGGDE